ncbi:S-adenosyl-L-methionine-dependent methyltransferase [Xylariomycetidae sp. FL0641]|nr:S-adenosyl-L-methionine-dependent methyltransferase [Xylariomycetidae sp. FL0641]
MPPKKQTSKKGGGGGSPPAAAGKKPAETQADFEEELRAMVRNAKQETWAGWAGAQAAVYGQAAALAALLALSANVSRLSLSPVYGAIAAARLHRQVLWTAQFVGWSANLALRRGLPARPARLLPLVAAYVPVARCLLFPLSGALGARYGPALTEALTLGPVVVLGAACIADTLDAADLDRIPRSVAGSLPGIGSYGLYKFFESASMALLFRQIGSSLLQTRVVLEFVLAAAYAAMGRSKLLLYALPALLHGAFFNGHLMMPHAGTALNATLHAEGYSLVDRWESATGYISVVDNLADGFRALRCDHSLLGGEWVKFPKIIVAEPIYSVFTQLEAVRLVEMPNKVPDSEAKALNIGLGIGTTPSALIAHGIDTTIVEIDPVVYDFAKKYFGLPSNHTAVIEDVVSWSQSNAASLEEHYDYIVHDVFTGGAEPVDLFTHEFLEGLKLMLKPDGVIAINYAGDFTLPPLSIVVNTIKDIFPSCRVFRESEAPSEEKVQEEGRDFDNVIIFCVKTDRKVTFRDPVERDFLKSYARVAYLKPKHEVPDSAFSPKEEVGMLRVNETEKLAKWHDQSGLGHWAVMRTVLPAKVWEQW